MEPGPFATQCAEPYRPRELRQPLIGVHSIAVGNVQKDEVDHSADAVDDSKDA